ncbi:MAG: PHB depolymerase family esterase, partial [Bacteroidota bacterium]
SSRLPLLLNFHGFGGTAAEFMEYTEMAPIADAGNFLLVFPQGSLLDGFPHWNAGLNTPTNKSNTDDLGFVDALIEELSSTYNIDEERVYASGFSNGAFFAYALACYSGDKIAAIASVGGTMMEETLDNCTPSLPTAMINIHGTADKVVSYEGDGEGLSSIEASLNFWINANNTNPSPITTSVIDRGTTIEHLVFAEGDSGITVEHYKVIGGGHEWLDIDVEGANTSQLIWEFLSRYDINGLR